ncbi:hypothetical protein BN1708_007892, partial [Verticillium longisporum]
PIPHRRRALLSLPTELDVSTCRSLTSQPRREPPDAPKSMSMQTSNGHNPSPQSATTTHHHHQQLLRHDQDSEDGHGFNSADENDNDNDNDVDLDDQDPLRLGKRKRPISVSCELCKQRKVSYREM